MSEIISKDRHQSEANYQIIKVFIQHISVNIMPLFCGLIPRDKESYDMALHRFRASIVVVLVASVMTCRR